MMSSAGQRSGGPGWAGVHLESADPRLIAIPVVEVGIERVPCLLCRLDKERREHVVVPRVLDAHEPADVVETRVLQVALVFDREECLQHRVRAPPLEAPAVKVGAGATVVEQRIQSARSAQGLPTSEVDVPHCGAGRLLRLEAVVPPREEELGECHRSCDFE